MKHLVLASFLTLGLCNTAFAITLKGGSCGGYARSSVRHVVEVKLKEDADWKALRTWSWRIDADLQMQQLQKEKKYHEVRIRTETTRVSPNHRWPRPVPRPMPKVEYTVQVKATGDSPWKTLERWTKSHMAHERRRELWNSGDYFDVQVRSVYPRPKRISPFLNAAP